MSFRRAVTLAEIEAAYRAHGHHVQRRAALILGNESDAREVVQEVFLSLVDNPEQFGARSALATWLYSATVHRCLNRLRDERTRARLLVERAATVPTPRHAPSAEHVAELRALLLRVPSELAQLAIHQLVDELSQERDRRSHGLLAKAGPQAARATRRRTRDREGRCVMSGSAHDSGCPSHLRFDRLIAGELSAAEAQSVEQHAIGCSRCGPKLAQMQRQHAEFSKVLPVAIVQRVRERERRMRRSWQLPSALAAAAAVLVWIAWPGLTPPSGVRSKGGTRLKFYVLHDGAVRPGFDGERVQPGDRLQFAYSSERDAYLAIVSIDASRKATAY